MSLLSKLIFKHTCPNCGKHNVDVLFKQEYDATSEESLPEQGEYEICRCSNCGRYFVSGEYPVHCHRCGGHQYMYGVYQEDSGRYGVYCKKCRNIPGRLRQGVISEEPRPAKLNPLTLTYEAPSISEILRNPTKYNDYYIREAIWDARGHYRMEKTHRVKIKW